MDKYKKAIFVRLRELGVDTMNYIQQKNCQLIAICYAYYFEVLGLIRFAREYTKLMKAEVGIFHVLGGRIKK